MKRERLIILLGILIALIFFYFGLDEWLKSKEEQVSPPPVVVKPTSPQTQPPQTPPTEKQEVKKEEAKQEAKPTPKQEEKEDLLAKKIKEEKEKASKESVAKAEGGKDKIKVEKQVPQKEHMEEASKTHKEEKKQQQVKPVKTYTVQVGAFTNENNAKKAAEKARKMGYSVKIVEEDNFYKVRLIVRTDNIESELSKLRKAFGSAIIKQ